MEIDLQRFTSYANNIFSKIFNAFTLNNIETLDHFIDDKLYIKLNDKITNNNKRISDLEILSSYVLDVKEKNDEVFVKQYISVKYTKEKKEDYFSTENKEFILLFKKKKYTDVQKESRKCPNCGSNMDINKSGKCEYCGSIYDLENYDFILTSIKKNTIL